jgi:hypothetical protein
MSVDFQWTTWCYIPEDRTLHGTLTVEAAGSSETVGDFLPEYLTSHPRRLKLRGVGAQM